MLAIHHALVLDSLSFKINEELDRALTPYYRVINGVHLSHRVLSGLCSHMIPAELCAFPLEHTQTSVGTMVVEQLGYEHLITFPSAFWFLSKWLVELK